MPWGQGGNPLGPFGGSAAIVQIDPHHPGALLAATSNAQLFRSEDSGDSWKALPFPATIARDPACRGGGSAESRRVLRGLVQRYAAILWDHANFRQRPHMEANPGTWSESSLVHCHLATGFASDRSRRRERNLVDARWGRNLGTDYALRTLSS